MVDATRLLLEASWPNDKLIVCEDEFIKPSWPSDKTITKLTSHLEAVTCLEAKKRRGKTTAMVSLAYWFRELFGLNIVTIGSRMGLKDSFGPYTFLDEREFIGQLDAISEITKHTPQKELQQNVEQVLSGLGVNIYRSALFFDEAYKLFNARSAMDKLVQLFGFFVAQSAHYHVTIVMSSPNRSMIDKRVRQQVDWWGRCSYIKRVQTTVVRFNQGLDHWKLNVTGPNYFPMFDSWTLLGYRAKQLEIGTT